MKRRLDIMVVLCITLCTAAVLVLTGMGNHGTSPPTYEGTDIKAAELIHSTGYIPWTHPFWQPPSQEVECMFFTLQAAAGGMVAGYILGYYRRTKHPEE